tara:strand:- start:2160 stop:2336 length:177 start_codon:yes stop_codon:yes gene_type:complete
MLAYNRQIKEENLKSNKSLLNSNRNKPQKGFGKIQRQNQYSNIRKNADLNAHRRAKHA